MDIRTRKSKHGGASVPVVKDPLDQTPGTRVVSTGIDDKSRSIIDSKITDIARPINDSQSTIGNPKTIIDSQKMIDNARNIIESPRAIINKAKTIIEAKIETKKTEQPQQHEEIKEQIERKKGKRETSLYRKMFGSREK